MRVACHVLRPFKFAHDGVTVEEAVEGDIAEVPADSVEGLTREGFVRPVQAKAIERAPENKAIESAPENKAAPARKTKAAG